MRRVLRVAFLVFISVILVACEGGYVTSGSRESSQLGSRGGWLEKSIRSANGSVTQSLEVGVSGLRLETYVTLEVEEGLFTIELLDEERNPTLSLQASPGNPASGRGYMVSRAGDANYRVIAEEAKGVHYRLEFEFVD